MGTELTTVSKILVAASMLEAERETFSAEDLIVRAWKAYPESFGLNGYRESFPDSNRVLSKLMGSTGLCARGWLEQVGTKTYRLTVLGRRVAVSLQTEVGVSVARGRDRARSIAVGAPAPSEPDESVVSVSVGDARSPRESDADRESDAAGEHPSGEHKSAALEEREALEAKRPAVSEAPYPLGAPRVEPARPRLRSVQGGASPKRPAPAPLEPQRAAEKHPTVHAVKPEARAQTPVRTARVEAVAPVVAPAPAHAASTAEPFDEALALGRLAVTPAAQKFTRGGLITFGDACGFWSIGPGMTGPQVQARIDSLRALLGRAEGHIARTHAAIRVHDRLELTLTSVVGLQGLHTMLSTRYARELEGVVARG